MEITKLEKVAKLEQNKVVISLDIELDALDFEQFDYQGLDLIDDAMIPDILLAISRMYKNKIKNGKILREKVGSLI